MADVRKAMRLASNIADIREWCLELGIDYKAAAEVYHEAVDAGLTRGRPAKVIQSAVLYVTARRSGAIVTIRSISQLTGEPMKNIRRAALLIDSDMPTQDIMTYVSSGAGRLGLPSDAEFDADSVRVDLGAPIRAAIILFVASHKCGAVHTMTDVATAAGVDVNNLRNYVRGRGELKPKARPQ